MTVSGHAIRSCLTSLLAQRSQGGSICPSEVARALGTGHDDWRGLMAPVRAEAQRLARAGVLLITQGPDVLDPDGPLKGPIRLRRGPRFNDIL